ncbi:MAG: hypothetical protein K0S25_240 [Bacillus sp. (in: firmicutes)]|jgi:hypothetical protein|nr:hypothetical protein [Bacillus sp. (in: firmicutes)]
MNYLVWLMYLFIFKREFLILYYEKIDYYFNGRHSLKSALFLNWARLLMAMPRIVKRNHLYFFKINEVLIVILMEQ